MAEAKTPIFWPPDVKNWLIGKDPDAGKDWRQEEKGTAEDGIIGCDWTELEVAVSNVCTKSLSCVWLFVTPWTAACQASLSITNSQSLLKLMSIKSVMPSNHLILCCPLLLLPSIFPASGSFPMSQFFASSDQSTGASPSTSVFPMNNQDWFPMNNNF